MVNTKSKPIPIKASSSSSTKYSSTSPPLSTSSSGASPQTSSSSNESPATTIQTLVVRPTNSSATIANQSKKTVTVPDRDVAPGDLFAQQLLPQNNCRPTKSDTLLKLEGATAAGPNVTNGNGSGQHSHHHISSDILDDLASRFIINVPYDERNNLIRICFQIELAHWFYLDFFFAGDEKKCGMKQFAMSLFQHIPFLRKHLSTIDKILENWKQYKLTVPTYGAILLSEDLTHVLLVQSYWAKSSWGFPKGKVNENEDPIHCATREVFEETGYDITHLIVQSDYIESIINDQYTRLYLVRNVPLKTLFVPRTRKEIKCCDWFAIDALPTSKNDANTKQSLGINANSFFMIMPFVKRLKKWVSEKRSAIADLSTSQSNINRIKFSSIHNFNNAGLANKKTDTKMPFKTVNSNSVASTLTPATQSQSFTATSQNNSAKVSSSKRQRHKSMGDLDGMMRSAQMINGFQNNLRLLNATTQLAGQPPTNVFNDLSSNTIHPGNENDLHDQRPEKNQKHNIRRQKSVHSGGNVKPTEPPAATTNAAKQAPSCVPPIKLASYHYDCVKESNLDPVKLNTKPSPRYTKLNNSEDIVCYNYNSSTSKATGNNENLDSFLDSKRKNAQANKRMPMATAKLSNRPPKSERSKSNLQGSTEATIDTKNIRVNGSTSSLNAFNLTESILESSNIICESSLPAKKEVVILKPSPHFDAWKDFSFSKRCITNVFLH